MNIDKYRKEDGSYEDECGVYYETASDFIRSGILGFCGCGHPSENLSYIRAGLEIINEYAGELPFDEWKKKAISIFGNTESEYFFYYWADKEELSEHGGSVPGWLTDKGKQILDDIREIENEQSTD